jgi:hypothetical protein
VPIPHASEDLCCIARADMILEFILVKRGCCRSYRRNRCLCWHTNLPAMERAQWVKLSSIYLSRRRSRSYRRNRCLCWHTNLPAMERAQWVKLSSIYLSRRRSRSYRRNRCLCWHTNLPAMERAQWVKLSSIYLSRRRSLGQLIARRRTIVRCLDSPPEKRFVHF